MVLDLSANLPVTPHPAIAKSLRNAAANRTETQAHIEEFRFGASASGHRLPPTRAAHRTRSRGIFLELATVAKLVLIVSAIGFLAGAYPGIAKVLTTMNPGPALVASASVPPSFFLPKNLR